MNLHYKIVEVWPSDHLIVARYWTDVLSEEFLASNSNRNEDGTPVRCRSDVSLTLPIPAPTGLDLEKFILQNAPKQWLKTLEDVVNPNVDTSLDHLKNMVGKVYTKSEKEINEMIDPSEAIMSDADIENLIKSIQNKS